MSQTDLPEDRAARFTDGYFIVVDPSGRILGRTDGQPLTQGDLEFIKHGPPSIEELQRHEQRSPRPPQ